MTRNERYVSNALLSLFPEVERLDIAFGGGLPLGVGGVFLISIGNRTSTLTAPDWWMLEDVVAAMRAVVLGLLHSAMKDIPKRKILRRRVRR